MNSKIDFIGQHLHLKLLIIFCNQYHSVGLSTWLQRRRGTQKLCLTIYTVMLHRLVSTKSFSSSVPALSPYKFVLITIFWCLLWGLLISIAYRQTWHAVPTIAVPIAQSMHLMDRLQALWMRYVYKTNFPLERLTLPIKLTLYHSAIVRVIAIHRLYSFHFSWLFSSFCISFSTCKIQDRN